ncbi:MAG: hypothetical protein ABEK50_12285 [bacterium]
MDPDQDKDIILKRVDRLEPGMTVARDIHSSKGCRLLSAGDELTYDDIDRLKRWNKRSIYIQDPDENSSEDQSGTRSDYREAS